MTTLRQAIADNLILDPETGEWKSPPTWAEKTADRLVDIYLPELKEQTDHE